MVAAVLIAFVAWMFVVYNYEPNIKVVYTEVPIRYVGEDALANKGYGVVSSDTQEITVTLNQKRVDTPNITAESISVVADVSEASEGENTIPLTISSPLDSSVVESSLRAISVRTEEIDRIDLPVYVEFADSEAGESEPVVSNLTSETVTVVGAASKIGSVDRAVAYIDLEDTADGQRTFTRQLTAVDREGNAVPHMVMYPDRVNFSAFTGVTKTVPVNIVAVDNSDDSYTRTCTGPESVTIKGAWEDVSAIDSIQTQELDLSRIYEDTELEVKYDLPEDVYLCNSVKPGTIKVTVTKKEETDTETEE